MKISLLFLFVFGLSLVFWQEESVKKRPSGAEIATVTNKIPTTTPPISQESIDKALLIFNITVPKYVLHPKLDLELKDRGSTSIAGNDRLLAFHRYRVTIGPAAFSSWGLLGSTLAHEIEGHCQQKIALLFYLVQLYDSHSVYRSLDGDPLFAAEREAYQLELKNARRFHLSKNEIKDIKFNIREYSSKDDGVKNSTIFRAFLSAKSFPLATDTLN